MEDPLLAGRETRVLREVRTQDREFRRYKTKQGRHSWTCIGCGRHKSATAGTIYEGSATSLHLWFYAAYLMTSTRCGISARQLEREIGVTYKCAWRMLNKLRNVAMADGLRAAARRRRGR